MARERGAIEPQPFEKIEHLPKSPRFPLVDRIPEAQLEQFMCWCAERGLLKEAQAA